MLEVITPATTASLVTLNEAKGYLGISGISQDPWLEVQIEAASKAVEGFLRRPIRSEIVEETFFNGRSTIVLERWPLISVTSVTEDGATLADGTDYKKEVRTGMLYRYSGGERQDWTGTTTVVRYTAGYATVPTPIKEAVYLAVKGLRESLARDVGVKSERLEGVASMSYFAVDGSGLPPEVTERLKPYQQVVL
jgi:hypothetical protein